MKREEVRRLPNGCIDMTDRLSLRTKRTLRIAALFFAACLASAAIWLLPDGLSPRDFGDLEGPSGGRSSAQSSLTVLISGDTAGWIVPCGCTSNQSGGLLRRGDFVAKERANGESIVVDAGGAPGGTSPYDRVKFEAILRGELAMGIAAHNLGGPEAAFGPDYLRRVQRELGVPFVSANLHDTAGQPIAEACRIVNAGGRRIAFLGVVSPRFATEGCRIGEPRDAVLATLTAQKDRFDAAVVLAYLPEAELRELAASLPEVDAVVGGPTGQAIAPTVVGPGLLASATNKGKFLVRLRLSGEGKSAAWSGDVVEMSNAYADDARQYDVLAAFRTELKRLDLSAAESGLVSSLGGGQAEGYRVAGSTACAECHIDEDLAWRASGHAHAWETLTKTGAHVDAACQQCHTTGFGMADGFVSAKRSAERTSVGCESCHGPSAAHVLDVKTGTPFRAADQCVRCHDRENSPEFEYAAYWSKIVHGPPQRPGPPRGVIPEKVRHEPIR